MGCKVDRRRALSVGYSSEQNSQIGTESTLIAKQYKKTCLKLHMFHTHIGRRICKVNYLKGYHEKTFPFASYR